MTYPTQLDPTKQGTNMLEIEQIEKSIAAAQSDIEKARLDVDKAKMKEGHFRKVFDFVRSIDTPTNDVLDGQEMSLLTMNTLQWLDNPWGDAIIDREEKERALSDVQSRLDEFIESLSKLKAGEFLGGKANDY